MDVHGEDDPDEVRVVIANMSIIHAEDLRAELAERVRGLAPGGRFVIEFHHHALSQVVPGLFDSIRPGHPLYFPLGSWRAAVQAFGLEVETAWVEDVCGGCLVVVARAGAVLDASADAMLRTERGAGINPRRGTNPWLPAPAR